MTVLESIHKLSIWISGALWLTTLLVTFYCFTAAMLVASGQGGHGEGEFILGALSALSSILLGLLFLTLSGFLGRFSFANLFKAFCGAILGALIATFSSGLLLDFSFWLAKPYFCEGEFRKANPSGALMCRCEPEKNPHWCG